MGIHRRFWVASWAFLIAVAVLVATGTAASAPLKGHDPGTASKRGESVAGHGKESLRRRTPRRRSSSTGSGMSSALRLYSGSVMVVHETSGEVIYAKNSAQTKPIASLTKLMTAMVTLDRRLPLNEVVTITDADVDRVKYTRSRLRLGTRLPRLELLRLALMSSENRAASALAQSDPQGFSAFVRAMNEKARALGMRDTHFVDSTGLRSGNVSTAEDLVKMVRAAHGYWLIRDLTTTPSYQVSLSSPTRHLDYINTNALVRAQKWDIGVSKTGYIREAGRCLVMQARLFGEPFILVFLGAEGKLTPVGDANRFKDWLERSQVHRLADTRAG